MVFMTTSFDSKVQLYDLHPPLDDFRAEVLVGLMQTPKSVSPKFLYDKRGAELFDAIAQQTHTMWAYDASSGMWVFTKVASPAENKKVRELENSGDTRQNSET